MNTHADKVSENKNKVTAAGPQKLHKKSNDPFQFVNNRPAAIAQKKLQESVDNSPRVRQLKAYQSMADSYLSETVQRNQKPEEEVTPVPFEPVQRKEDTTSLPYNLKAGIENLSGFSMDDVKVHRNSDKPAQLQAHAYAQGTNIHLAPGQEQHLPHEAWHVVQQKQGRVSPTMQLKGNTNINDDDGLEKEADAMGGKALAATRQLTSYQKTSFPTKNAKMHTGSMQVNTVTQRLAVGDADYTLGEKRAAIAHAKLKVTKKNAKSRDFAVAMAAYLINDCGGAATNYKVKGSLETHCENWWNKPSLVDDAVVVVARKVLTAPLIEYSAKHGDLHFISKPTDKKSAWTLAKATALTLMETEIRRHISAMSLNSARKENTTGWSQFYITAQHAGPVGDYHGQKVKQAWPSTDHFTIQAQMNYNDNLISYHGFPDEKIENHRLGCSFNKTDATKF